MVRLQLSDRPGTGGLTSILGQKPLAPQDQTLSGYVREEFEALLRCGVFDPGFLHGVCERFREPISSDFGERFRDMCSFTPIRTPTSDFSHRFPDTHPIVIFLHD